MSLWKVMTVPMSQVARVGGAQESASHVGKFVWGKEGFKWICDAKQSSGGQTVAPAQHQQAQPFSSYDHPVRDICDTWHSYNTSSQMWSHFPSVVNTFQYYWLKMYFIYSLKISIKIELNWLSIRTQRYFSSSCVFSLTLQQLTNEGNISSFVRDELSRAIGACRSLRAINRARLWSWSRSAPQSPGRIVKLDRIFSFWKCNEYKSRIRSI